MAEYIAGKRKLTNETYSNIYETVKSLGKNFSSIEDVIEVRNAHDLDHPVWQTYGWTREMRLLQRESPVLLLRNSLLLDERLAKQAVEASQRGELFYQDKKTYESQLRTAEKEDKTKKPLEKRKVLILPERKTFQITPKKNFEVLRFLAGPKQAETYLSNLAKKDIDALNFYLPDVSFVDNQEDPYVQEAWFNGLAGRSNLNGDDRGFNYDNGAFGVFENLGEAQTQKISKRKNSELYPYTNTELNATVELIQGVKEGRIGNSKLEQVLSFIQKLPRKK